MQDNKYSIVIEYQNGLRITCYDLHDNTTEFWVKIYIKQQKQTRKLIWENNSVGGQIVDELITNSETFKIPFAESAIKSAHFTEYFYRGLVPYHIEIYKRYTDDLIYSESFDCRHKLINFTLHSNDPKELHTWVCAIKKFKEENNCEISVTNDRLWETKEYDFIDAYYRTEDNFTQYYAGFNIGRFGNENTPDLYRNPDGLKNKTSLDIIEDILYHYTKNL
jgi:hypothetical protein